MSLNGLIVYAVVGKYFVCLLKNCLLFSSVAQKVECKFSFVCSSVCLLCPFNVDVVFFLLAKKGGQKGDNKKLLLLAFSKNVRWSFWDSLMLVLCVALLFLLMCIVLWFC